MGSLVGGLFGGKSESSSIGYSPAISIKGKGSKGAFGGRSRISIDPEGRSSISLPRGIAQQRGLLAQDIRNIYGDVTSDIGELRSLENPFIRARVRPLENRFAEARSGLQRDLGRRGVQGTLANRELLNFDTEAGRQIADQTALAQASVLDAVMARQGFQQNLLQNIRGLTQDEVSQALNELQLVLSGTQTSQAARRQTSTRSEGSDTGEGLSNLGTIAKVGASFFL